MNDMSKPATPARDTDNLPDPTSQMPLMTEMLTAQARSLDALFVELARQATGNLKTFPGYAPPFVQMACRAQSNCRSALEALARAERAAQRMARLAKKEKIGERAHAPGK